MASRTRSWSGHTPGLSSVIFALVLVGLSPGAGCSRHSPAALPASSGPSGSQQHAASGQVADGVYVDARWRLSLPIPAGWTAAPGLAEGQLRITLSDPVTGTDVEIWAFTEPTPTLRPRGDCVWDFVDQGRYRVLGQSMAAGRSTTTGTCTSASSSGDVVFGWLLPGPEVTVQAEIHVPPGALLAGRRAGEQAVAKLEQGR